VDALAQTLGITNYTRPYRSLHTSSLAHPVSSAGGYGAMVVWVMPRAPPCRGGVAAGSSVGRLVGPSLTGGLGLFVPSLATLLAGQSTACSLSAWPGRWGGWCDGETFTRIWPGAGRRMKVIPWRWSYLFWRRRWRPGWSQSRARDLDTCCVPVVGWQGLADYAQSAVFLGRPDTVYTWQQSDLYCRAGKSIPCGIGHGAIGWALAGFADGHRTRFSAGRPVMQPGRCTRVRVIVAGPSALPLLRGIISSCCCSFPMMM